VSAKTLIPYKLIYFREEGMHPIRRISNRELLKAQRNEITEYHVYTRIAKTLPNDEENRRIVEEIGEG
jgi:hypothetical protein